MFDFEKISTKQILVFSGILYNATLFSIEILRNKYQRESINFDNAVQFLVLLGLIKVENGNIIPSATYKSFFNALAKSNQKEDIVNEFIIDNLMISANPDISQAREFISKFYITNNRYEFKPDIKQRLEYSGIRNFLMGLEVVYLDGDNETYIVADKYVPQVDKHHATRNISPSDFKKTQEDDAKIGELAEIEIIEYEKKRLYKHPELIKSIEHTALSNIAAGYDIKSYSVNDSGDITPRHIEVKAVSFVDYGFNWTRNEIEKSKIFGSNYYLYLLPIVSSNKFSIEKLKIILDPFSKIYNNQKEWNKQEESVSFRLNTKVK